MTCASCGGRVLWRGPLTALTHTQCEDCGAINNHVPEEVPAEPQEEES